VIDTVAAMIAATVATTAAAVLIGCNAACCNLEYVPYP